MVIKWSPRIKYDPIEAERLREFLQRIHPDQEIVIQPPENDDAHQDRTGK